MSGRRSKVEHLVRVLRRISLVLFILWLLSAVAAIAWVDDEFGGDASVWRYVTAVADVGTFLIAAVLAYVGSAIVQSIGRVRNSIIQAMFERVETSRAGEPLNW